MAFSAQLTEQGQAQRLSGERASEKEQQIGRGNGCWVDLPPSPPPAMRLQLYMLQEQACVNLSA